MDKKVYDFIKLIHDYFDANSHLGKIKTISLIGSINGNMRFRVRCIKKKEYIVYEKNREIFNVGIYREELV